MKKIIKIAAGVVAVVLVLLIGFIATLPLTISPLVQKGAAAAGPKLLGVRTVSVGDVQLKPVAGQLILSDLKIGNPEGYSENDSFAVKTVDIDLKTSSLVRGDTIYIERIFIDAPAILYESQNGKSNFDTMLEKAQKAEKEQKEDRSSDDEAKKKVVIEEFVLNGSTVAYSSKLTFGKAVTVPLPPIKMKDIGKDSGGVNAIEALEQVMSEILGGLRDAVTGAASSIGGGAADAARKSGEAAKSAAESTTAAAGDVADSAEKAAKDAAESAGKAAEDAGKKLKGLFGK
ncbi:MAG: AsmA family protein [Kiritimatiellia bacterium]